MAYINARMNKDMFNTPLSNQFIDKYMPKANPAFSCIYIYTFRHCYSGGAPISTKDLADTFNLLESDVIKAWEYWQKMKLVQIHNNDGDSMSIEFLPIPETATTADQVMIHPSAYANPPKYSPRELELYKSSYDEIDTLFTSAEKILGKMLNASDLSTLYSFYDWLRMPTDLILYLLEYCAGNGHRRMRYIETVAVDWAENGIDSVEKAQEHVNIYNKDFREIMKALGQSSRNPAPKEIEYMKKWLMEYTMPLPLILEACDKTIMALGKAQFSYTDKIIEGWHSAGAKSIEDIKALDAVYKNTKQPQNDKASPKGKAAPERKSRFANYEPHSRNYDEIEKLEWEYLKNSLKGK